MNTELNLIVLKNVLSDELFGAFVKSRADESNFYDFLNKLYEKGCEDDFFRYAEELVLCDDNAFSRCCAAGGTPSKFVTEAYKKDLCAIFNLVKNAETKGYYSPYCEHTPPFDKHGNLDVTCYDLKTFYAEHGYGKFIKHTAFKYDSGLVPIDSPSEIKLSELKDYEGEKKEIENNIINFMKGLPYSNMLLYGDRGTGKSSTVHALVNKHAKDGLKIVEIYKENLKKLSEVSQKISKIPLKFIIFIDDLSLDESDDLSGLKASLEGSLEAVSKNVMIVATSNRRHIVKESFSDRENAVHERDAMEEQLSLSDRFGLTVVFSSTDKAQYISIVKQLAADRKLKTAEAELIALAERWALVKGGRSPRRAKQFIDLVYSCEVRSEAIDF